MSRSTKGLHRARHLRTAAIAALACAALAVAGCGDDDEAVPAANAASGASSAGIEEAKKVVAEAAVRPDQIPVTKPIDKPIPSGKNIVFISCGVEACAIQGPLLAEAASALGWTVKQVATDGTPEKLQGAFDTAIRDGADAVIVNAANLDILAKQVADAEKAGVEFVTCCSLDEPGNGLLYNTATDEQNAAIGDYLAAEVVTDGGGKANSLYVNISVFEILKTVGDSFTAAHKKYCAECTVDTIDIPLTALGKDAPDRIVSYLRSHPDVNYVALSVSDALGAGLPAALKAAGLTDVKVVGQGGGAQQLQDLRNGEIHALVPADLYSYDYLMIDALARKWAGVPLEEAGPPYWLIKQDTVPANTEAAFPVVEDYKAQWLELWGKG
jgi:ABC-type sugar transport system substrate-binding protein